MYNATVREWFTCTSLRSNHMVTCRVPTVTWTVDGFSRCLGSDCRLSPRESTKRFNRSIGFVFRNVFVFHQLLLTTSKARFLFLCMLSFFIPSLTYTLKTLHYMVNAVITPPPIGGRGIVFARFLCSFV